MSNTHRLFWRQHPALLFSLTLLIGVGAALFWETPWNYLYAALWSLYLIWMRKWPLLPLLASMSIYAHMLYTHAPTPGKTQGIFSIATLQPHQSPFAKGFVYKGTLYTSQGVIPCDIYTNGFEPPIPANCDYFVTGNLDQRGSYQYSFKVKKWTPIENTWSLAHLRYLAKERYRNFLKEKCPYHPKAAVFLTALSTGDVDDRMLKYEFGRLGLQHLLAISGFHFGILIAFVSFILSLFLPRFWKFIALIFSLTAYYFFVGPFPAVQRSWLTAIVYLVGKLIHRNTNGLNLLGFAMGFETISNPLIVSNLGFQFSFTSTAGILLFYPIIEKKLQSVLSKRQPFERTSFSIFEKQIYLCSSFFRKSIALTLAVNAAISPILFFHFHTFPLLSLLYNLFFPFLVGVALMALLFALTLHFLIPSLSDFTFSFTSSFTEKLLDLTAYPPVALDYPILIESVPAVAIPCFLFFLLLIAIRNHH